MSQQTINIGTAPNDGTGTPLRTAFDYCNLNFTELYTAVGPSGNNIVVPGTATITGNLTVDTNTLFVDAANNYVGVGTVTPHAQFFSTLNATGVVGRLNTNTIGSAIAASYQTAGITNGTLPFGIRCTGNVFAGISGQVYASQIVTESTAALALEIFNTGNTPIVFGVNGAESMRLNSTGLGVGVTPSAGRGAIQLSAGVGFPATQVASSDANTLDDYEEGIWTGTLKGSVSDPTIPVTVSGQYTKIGRLVHVSINFSNVSTVGASGNISITGLPFTSANDGVGAIGSAGFYLAGTFTGSPDANIIPNSTVIDFFWSQSNGVSGNVTHNAGVGRYINATIVYHV
jgi:hypothetical protein